VQAVASWAPAAQEPSRWRGGGSLVRWIKGAGPKPRGAARKPAGESGICGLSCAGRSARTHGRVRPA
jgi:hypothetical protein